jgi:CheY-like chemotaxis protein
LELIASDPPDVIVLDVMLRWTDASPVLSQELPVEVKQQGFYVAGFRCVGYLKRNPRTAAIPYVLYTGLGQENFEDEEVVTKSEDLEPLVRAISKRCRGRMGA